MRSLSLSPGTISIVWLAVFAFSLLTQTAYGVEPLTPEIPKRPKVLMDYYHHAQPQLRFGKNLVTGSYEDNLGRYGLDDFSHSNSFDPLFEVLEKEFALIPLAQPFTTEVVKDADIVTVFMPDSPEIRPDAPLIGGDEIDILESFVANGGSLLLMTNGYHPKEKIEGEHFRNLFKRFGLDWNNDDTLYVDIPIGPEHPYFYDIDVFHYGAGCTLKYTGQEDLYQPILDVFGAPGYEEVRGVGIASVRHGKGKVIAVGDTGSWTGNLSRPWVKNKEALIQLFRMLKPDQGVQPSKHESGTRLKYSLNTTLVNVVPVANSLSKIPLPDFRKFQPRERTVIPYLEMEAEVEAICTGVSDRQVADYDVSFSNFKKFEESVPLNKDAGLRVRVNRLGEAFEWEGSDGAGEILTPEVQHLFAFIPHDGIRVGDRWGKSTPLQILPIQAGSDPPVLKEVIMETCFLGEEMLKGRNCRKFMTTFCDWMDEIGVTAADMLSSESEESDEASHYRFRAGRGGDLLYKRVQWIDRETGVVVKSVLQQRSILWIEDDRVPLEEAIADIDNKTIVTNSLVSSLELKD